MAYSANFYLWFLLCYWDKNEHLNLYAALSLCASDERFILERAQVANIGGDLSFSPDDVWGAVPDSCVGSALEQYFYDAEVKKTNKRTFERDAALYLRATVSEVF